MSNQEDQYEFKVGDIISYEAGVSWRYLGNCRWVCLNIPKGWMWKVNDIEHFDYIQISPDYTLISLTDYINVK